jgi:hypothetical protein
MPIAPDSGTRSWRRATLLQRGSNAHTGDAVALVGRGGQNNASIS